jgi:small-conductance mechanosensitive channel
MNLIMSTITTQQEDYLVLFSKTVFFILIIYLFTKLFIYFNTKYTKNIKAAYGLNRFIKIARACSYVFIVVYFWHTYMGSTVTIISFTSAAMTLALRDIILNMFSGFFIKLGKPFVVEDRIEVDETIGDVININMLNFEVLEVSPREQSTGIIVEVPNSLVFSGKVKNYTKAFKYVWSEMTLKVDMNKCDIKNVKSILYKIINQNEIVKNIPDKMAKEMNNAVKDYRIYYNHLEPVIYTNVIDDYAELTMRFLVHPKKRRYVESEIWNQIVEEVENGNIKLKSFV